MVIKEKPKNKYLRRFLIFTYNSVLCFVFVMVMFNISGCKKQVEPTYYLTLNLKPDQRVNYTIELNNSQIKTGTLESTWNEVNLINKGGDYIIYYWNNAFYKDYIEMSLYYNNQNFTITKELPLKKENKKGSIDISLSESLRSGEEQEIRLIFKANGTVKKFSYCLYRTIGIIYSEPIRNTALCDNVWTNVTPYGNLTNDLYFCDKIVTECERTSGVLCYNGLVIFPELEVDDCYFIGKTLMDEEYHIPLKTNTMSYYDERDHLKVSILDMDITNRKRVLGKVWGYDWNDVMLEKVVR